MKSTKPNKPNKRLAPEPVEDEDEDGDQVAVQHDDDSSGDNIATIVIKVASNGDCTYTITPHHPKVAAMKVLAGKCKPKGVANRVLYAVGLKSAPEAE